MNKTSGTALKSILLGGFIAGVLDLVYAYLTLISLVTCWYSKS